MFTELHLIRPYWLLTLIPFVAFAWHAWLKNPGIHAWSAVCDNHLLPYLIHTKPQLKRHFSLMMLLSSLLLMIIGLSGPSWSRFPVPTYKPIQPRVILLNLSDGMLANDLPPSRLDRAKFKLHDLFNRKSTGQLGMLVYTGEPFVVSPLTDDGQTIDNLLSMLTPDVMPVTGNNLKLAMDEGQRLIRQAGFHQGSLLVLTDRAPDRDSIEKASQIKQEGIDSSIMPILSHVQQLNPQFQRFASAGGGQVLPLSDTASDIKQWLQTTQQHQAFGSNSGNEMPVWKDQGRWFILPAALLLLPVFRRGWLQRIAS